MKKLFLTEVGFQSTTLNEIEKNSKVVKQYNALFQNINSTLNFPI